ncbi:hypothetical protein [Geothrix limicola]|uniref:hypothetical protein n=1 Tax=Geothrix limicola TaxID=2927978 RepID=UPI0025545DEA|nr:hypothetical protein [Geothrix limicola]
MRAIYITVALLFLSAFSVLQADGNVESSELKFALSRNNRANVVRLKNDKKIVRYILEAYLDGWEIDGPDDQLGGALCLRINKAGGRYIPGCLLCKNNGERTYSPTGCFGVITKAELEDFLQRSIRNNPVVFTGYGMNIVLKITKLEFSEERDPASKEQKVKALNFEIDIQSDGKIPISQPFSRK